MIAAQVSIFFTDHGLAACAGRLRMSIKCLRRRGFFDRAGLWLEYCVYRPDTSCGNARIVFDGAMMYPDSDYSAQKQEDLP